MYMHTGYTLMHNIIVPVKDNVALTHVLALACSCSIIRIAQVTRNGLVQFERFSTPCLKGTTIECRAHERFNLRMLLQVQGGDTPIYSVLRSSSSVKMKVKGQAPKNEDGQRSNCFLAGQESTSHLT